MKESIGMIPTLAIVMAAFVLITSYLAFTVNSNKAYKTNSRIVNLIEKYDNTDPKNHKGLRSEIDNYIKKIGYTVSSDRTVKCRKENWETIGNQGWCYKIVISDEDNVSKTIYTKVKTFISVDIPIFNKIFAGLEPFEINGSTKVTKIKIE